MRKLRDSSVCFYDVPSGGEKGGKWTGEEGGGKGTRGGKGEGETNPIGGERGKERKRRERRKGKGGKGEVGEGNRRWDSKRKDGGGEIRGKGSES